MGFSAVLNTLLIAACSPSGSMSASSPTPTSLRAGNGCPISPSQAANTYSPDFGDGPAFGAGPVYALFAGGLGSTNNGWREAKILWMSNPRAPTHYWVTGEQFGGGGPVAWNTGGGSLGGVARLEVYATLLPTGWGNQPSTSMVK